MNSFIYKAVFLSSPLLLVLVMVNYFGDAAKIFDSDYEKQISEIILNGNFVSNISNYDERLFQKELINGMIDVPEVVVLGSSRTMLIDSTFFPNRSFFNNSVSGASIEDFIALFQIHKERNSLPKKVIIGIDPWLFNENNGQTRWNSLKLFYDNYHKNSISKLLPNYTYKYGQLISLSYFQTSLKALMNKGSGYSKPISTQKKYNKTNTRLTDGSLVYGESYRSASQAEINSKARKFIQGNIYSIENFKTISESIWIEFEKLIDKMNNNNIEIEFFLCPYHPKVYEKIQAGYPMVLQTEDLIIKFSKDHDIKLHGSFNPSKIGLDESYFYDGMHCNEKGVEKILQTDN